MQFVFVPVWGRLSDRVGRRPVLVWSIFGTVLGMGGLAFSLAFGTSAAWLFTARIFTGVATANLGTASAYIADVTKPEARARGMALIGIAFGLGFIFGPMVGGILAKYPVNGRLGVVPCMVAAGLSVINFVWVVIGLPESLPKERRSHASRRLTPLDIAATRRTLATPGVGLVVAINFLIILSFTNLDQTFRFFNKDLFGMDEMATGITLGIIGVCAALTQGAVRQLSKRYSDAMLIRTGLATQAFGFAALAFSPAFGKWALYAASALVAIGNGLSQPSVSAFLSKRADASAQGETLGTNQSFASLGRMFGPAMGGYLYGHLGPRTPYITASLGMVAAYLVSSGLRRFELAAAPVEAPAS
jgi:MFS family permease